MRMMPQRLPKVDPAEEGISHLEREDRMERQIAVSPRQPAEPVGRRHSIGAAEGGHRRFEGATVVLQQSMMKIGLSDPTPLFMRQDNLMKRVRTLLIVFCGNALNRHLFLRFMLLRRMNRCQPALLHPSDNQGGGGVHSRVE